MAFLMVSGWWISRNHPFTLSHRIHGAAIYGNMDPINIPQMLAYMQYMDPMGNIKRPLPIIKPRGSLYWKGGI
jgi:hypothetical protein